MTTLMEPDNPPSGIVTPQEYLAFENYAEGKHEYMDGLIHSMGGASWMHCRITNNLIGTLYWPAKEGDYEVFAVRMLVEIPECQCFLYPDLVVVLGEPLCREVGVSFESLLNPAVVLEVYSHRTEPRDRGKKWLAYQMLPSLKTYLLISEYQPKVEIYRRQEQGWDYSVVEGLEGVVVLEAIGCELPMAEIYRRITFDLGVRQNERLQEKPNSPPSLEGRGLGG